MSTVDETKSTSNLISSPEKSVVTIDTDNGDGKDNQTLTTTTSITESISTTTTPSASNSTSATTTVSSHSGSGRPGRRSNNLISLEGNSSNKKKSGQSKHNRQGRRRRDEIKQDESAKYCPWSLSEPLEACDIQGNWYEAKIVQIKNYKVKIHFLRWKKRYDQWFDMDTNLIRPRVDKVSSSINNGDKANTEQSLKFILNEEVLARWTDTKFYPARITTMLKGGQYCHVLFYDGYRKKVKLSSLQKMPENYQGQQVPPPLQTSSAAGTFATGSSVIGLSSATGPGGISSFTESTTSGPIVSTPIGTVTTSGAISGGIVPTSEAFVCDTCNKNFRKESLLLQHKKHYHKMDDENVPSLVPPQLRINKTHKHSLTSKSYENSGGSPIGIPEGKLTTGGGGSKPSSLKSEYDSSGDTDVEAGSSCGKKRKLENNRYVDSPSSAGMVKTDDESTVIGQDESTTTRVGTPTPSTSGNYSGSLNTSGMSTRTNVPMKPLTVVIPTRKYVKPNNVLMFKDARQEADEHENDNIDEFVRCTCPLDEESGLMVQCELCLTWQHGLCAGFNSENDVPPAGYFCHFCRYPPRSVRSQQNCYQLNHWLKNAQHPQFTPMMFETITNQSADQDESKNNGSNQQQMFRNSLYENDRSTSNWTNFFNQNSSSTNNNSNNVNERKSFTLHDLSTNHHSAGHGTDFHAGDDSSNANHDLNLNSSSRSHRMHGTSEHGHQFSGLDDDLMNLNHHSKSTGDYFASTDVLINDDHHLVGGHSSSMAMDNHHHDQEDEDEEDMAQIRAINQLSSALFDCAVNLHSLNFKLHNHPEISCQQIIDRQQMIKENLEIILAKIEKIEKEIEQKDSYAIHTSSSTLSATSPENYGIGNCDLLSVNQQQPSPIGNLSSTSAGGGNTYQSQPLTLPSAPILNLQPISSFASKLTGQNTATSPATASAASTGPSQITVPLSAAILTKQSTSQQQSSPFSTSTGLFGTLSDPILLQEQQSQTTQQPTLSSLNSTSDLLSTVPSSAPSSSSLPPPPPPPPLLPSVSSTQQKQQSSPSTSGQSQALARLFFTTSGNGPNGEQADQTLDHYRHNRPSMTHEYLPVNLNDSELKLELAYHYKDLQIAREVVLLSAK